MYCSWVLASAPIQQRHSSLIHFWFHLSCHIRYTLIIIHRINTPMCKMQQNILTICSPCSRIWYKLAQGKISRKSELPISSDKSPLSVLLYRIIRWMFWYCLTFLNVSRWLYVRFRIRILYYQTQQNTTRTFHRIVFMSFPMRRGKNMLFQWKCAIKDEDNKSNI